MANKDTIEKVKSLLEGHCYGPLREAAEKWLAVADEKYDVKDKAGKAWDKLNDAVDKVADASGKFNETMDKVSDKLADAYDSASEKAGPTLDKLGDYAEKLADKAGITSEKLDEIGDKAGDAAEKLAASELVKQLKEGINTVGDLIKTFGADDAKEKFGEEMAEKVKTHAEELKEKGIKFCDCDACRKAREILKDFGEDIEAAADKAEDKIDEVIEKVEDKIEE